MEKDRSISIAAMRAGEITEIDGAGEFRKFLSELHVVNEENTLLTHSRKSGIENTLGPPYELPLRDSPVKPENDESIGKAFQENLIKYPLLRRTKRNKP